jgi:hypothetical protein
MPRRAMTNPYLELTDQFNHGRPDRERRTLMRADEERLGRYCAAAEAWASAWPDVSRQIAALPLREAHRIVTDRAEGVLPFVPPG